ncbi:MAG: glycosyltransferase family 4 protein, partial [Euryarchaeota archaeon]|nr:glycosyltransferase family 4 protein [Euryarchaeota archaeon]
MPRKILMLLSNEYRPDPRVGKEAEALLGAGDEVTILCWDRGHSGPRSASSGRLRIERVRTGRVASVGSFLLNYPLFCLRTILRGLGTNVDVVHCHDLDTLPQGVFLSRLKGVPLVYDAHEHYSKMIASDVPGVISSALELAERTLVKAARVIVAANAKIAEY